MKSRQCVGLSSDQWKASNAWVYAVNNEKQAWRVRRLRVLRVYKVRIWAEISFQWLFQLLTTPLGTRSRSSIALLFHASFTDEE